MATAAPGATTSPNTNLDVSSSGVVTTSGGTLAAGNYTVSGTDTDAYGDSGTWSYHLAEHEPRRLVLRCRDHERRHPCRGQLHRLGNRHRRLWRQRHLELHPHGARGRDHAGRATGCDGNMGPVMVAPFSNLHQPALDKRSQRRGDL